MHKKNPKNGMAAIYWRAILIFLFLLIAIIGSSEVAKSSESGGELLVNVDGTLYQGHAIVPFSRDDCRNDATKCSARVLIKAPPSTGMARVVGAKNVFLKSKQFEYKNEPYGLFGWREKKVYQDFLPIDLPMPDNGITVYKIFVMSQLGGIQSASLYVYAREDYKMPIAVDCNGSRREAVGVSWCDQFRGTSFDIVLPGIYEPANDASEGSKIGVIQCGKEPYIFPAKDLKRELKSVADDCYTILRDGEGRRAIVFGFAKQDRVELPNPVFVADEKAYRIGFDTELAQCGKKRFHKDRIETKLVDCYGEDAIYQWSKDGNFRFDLIK